MNRLSRALPLAAVAILAVGVGVILPFGLSAVALQTALIVAIGIALIGPLIYKAAHRELDAFEPLVFFAVVWGLMFVVRPLAMRASGNTWLRGTYNVAGGITPALEVGLISALAFVVGYWVAGRHRQGVRPPPLRRGQPPVWTVALPAIVGLGAMWVLRGSTFQQAAVGSGAYVYLAPLLTIPAVVLLLRRKNTGLAAGLLLITSVGFVGLGQRAFVIWPISCALIYWYLSRGKRPSLGVIAAITICGLLPIFTVLDVARERNVSPLNALSAVELRDPAAAIDRFAAGDTTEMFSALALQLLTEGRLWHQRPGYWLYSTPTRVVPHKLWAGKPLGSSEYLYQLYFPEQYRAVKAGTLFTLASEFYFDSGVAGIVVGLLGIGWMFGRLWRWTRVRLDDPWTWTLYAPLFGLTIILVRGDVGLSLGLAVFVFGPVILALAAAKPRAAESSVPRRVANGPTPILTPQRPLAKQGKVPSAPLAPPPAFAPTTPRRGAGASMDRAWAGVGKIVRRLLDRRRRT